MRFLASDYYVKDPRVIDVDEEPKHHKDLNYREYVRRSAVDSDYDELIKENIIVIKDGKPVLVYLVIPEMPSIQMVKYLKRVRYLTGRRTAGLKIKSKLFGYSPREKIRKDFCSSTALSFEDPEAHEYVCNFGTSVASYYKKYCPEIFVKHMKETKGKVSKEWVIHGSPFTSGVINRNNPLKYHYDSGNFEQVYSNMVAFKKDCRGGHLAVPEYNIGLEIGNKSIVFFDGQALIHGVTPFRLTSPEGYRYTVVYYTLKAMWQCRPVTEELARIKTLKTEREMLRYKLLTGAELTPLEKEKVDLLEEKSSLVTKVTTDKKR